MFLKPKVDTLENHAGKTKVVRDMPHLGKKKREWYDNKKCNHARNQVVYFEHNNISIVKQIQGGVKGE